jgi:hypothetical protein
MAPESTLRRVLPLLACIAVLLPTLAMAEWASQPGDTVRNTFGPLKGENASVCRGACGLGCPSSCKQRTVYECQDSERMLRVNTYICSTHEGCRVQDDCLDACTQNQAEGFDCQTYCHSEAVNAYGLPNASSWAGGGGPFDGPPIVFEYTRDTPNGLEPAFRCPEGTQLQCSGGKGQCMAANGAVEPVFDSYPGAGAGAMQISSFRAGPLCGDSVCQQATVIRVTGQDACERGACTKYGVEFNYQNATPAVPLVCTGEVTGGGDFVGNMLKKGADMIPQQGDGTGEDGMAELIGMFQQVLKSADTPEDVQITMAPLDENGNPIESQRVGSTYEGPASVPRTVEIPAANGHMVVPMYQLVDIQNKDSRTRDVRCSHKGVPVFEVTFQLQF